MILFAFLFYIIGSISFREWRNGRMWRSILTLPFTEKLVEFGKNSRICSTKNINDMLDSNL